MLGFSFALVRTIQGGFASAVAAKTGAGAEAGPGAQIHHKAAAAAAHERHRGPHGPVVPEEVGVHEASDLGLGETVDGATLGDAGAVDQHIYGGAGALELLDYAAAVWVVKVERQPPPAFPFDLGDEARRALRRPRRRDDVLARGERVPREREAEPRRAAGNKPCERPTFLGVGHFWLFGARLSSKDSKAESMTRNTCQAIAAGDWKVGKIV